MALAEGATVQKHGGRRDGDVVLGEDWVAPDTNEKELQARRARRGLFSLNKSPLTRKIVTFNLIALNILAGGILYLTSSGELLSNERTLALLAEAELVADVIEQDAATLQSTSLNAATSEKTRIDLENLDMRPDVTAYVFNGEKQLIARAEGKATGLIATSLTPELIETPILDVLGFAFSFVDRLLPSFQSVKPTLDQALPPLIEPSLAGQSVYQTLVTNEGRIYAVSSPIIINGTVAGAVALTGGAQEIEHLARIEREKILQMVLIATLVSIGLSLVLASTISNPLSDLAAAAEIGRDRDHRNVKPGRIRIPDLTARPDEIGRLSGALRGMVSALYERIDANEQFAADVAHEIKNPLASLRSAVGTMRYAQRDDQREKLLSVIEHDVRRLDRLVSDISNASRLDSELVKEEEVEFDLLQTINNLAQFFGQEASSKGVEFITDLPKTPIYISGLEARLAQVFVNLISNALSFCEDGDAIRVWARKRENRVLVVVEDTGPGIPDQALTKIFNRFYSERPPTDFGNNSGLGLAISKQIIEAHGGVIWAENIRPTEADATSDPLGARFVVGLPV